MSNIVNEKGSKVASTTLKESGPAIVKRIRATLDFKVHIRPITLDSVREYYKDKSDEEIPWELPERESRLLLALLGDENALKKYLTSFFLDHLQDQLDTEPFREIAVEKDQEIFELIYSRINEEDAQFFREIEEEDLFYDYTDHLLRAFTVEWLETELIELNVIEDDVSQSVDNPLDT
jgi:hypothetical protein